MEAPTRARLKKKKQELHHADFYKNWASRKQNSLINWLAQAGEMAQTRRYIIKMGILAVFSHLSHAHNRKLRNARELKFGTSGLLLSSPVKSISAEKLTASHIIQTKQYIWYYFVFILLLLQVN